MTGQTANDRAKFEVPGHLTAQPLNLILTSAIGRVKPRYWRLSPPPQTERASVVLESWVEQWTHPISTWEKPAYPSQLTRSCCPSCIVPHSTHNLCHLLQSSQHSCTLNYTRQDLKCFNPETPIRSIQWATHLYTTLVQASHLWANLVRMSQIFKKFMNEANS